MARKFMLASLSTALVCGAAAYAYAAFTLPGPAKVAFLYFAEKTDGGWTQAFEEARPKIEAALGMQIPFVENVPEVAGQIRPAAERFIQRGFNVIIGTAFGYSDTFKELSEKYPKVAFVNASGTTNGPNLESFYGRTYESQYLCGMVAGAMSKTGKLGFVAAHPIGPVNWTINAYRARRAEDETRRDRDGDLHRLLERSGEGARRRAGAWPTRASTSSASTSTRPTPQIVAQERGIYGTGHHRDLREFAPKATLCSSAWTWDKHLIPTLKKIAAGGWKPSPYGAFPGIKDGGTDIACCNTVVPKEVVDKVMAERDAIIGGKHVYAGPLKDIAGTERVAAGKSLDDGGLWKMDWYVPGVITQK